VSRILQHGSLHLCRCWVYRSAVENPEADMCRFAHGSPGVAGSKQRTVSCFCEKAAAVDSLQSASAGPGPQLDGVSQSAEAVQEKRKRNAGFSATASQDLEDIEEINHTNYYDKIKNAGTPVVLIDFYTTWCGPCKLIYPTLLEMKDELSGKVCSCFFERNWLHGR
jgi:thiol-disulfide isomerase/thioredoxin